MVFGGLESAAKIDLSPLILFPRIERAESDGKPTSNRKAKKIKEKKQKSTQDA